MILIQEHEFTYTFSSRLKPWVHYVPLSYNTADVIDKIEYLLANDDLAKRLATNSYSIISYNKVIMIDIDWLLMLKISVCLICALKTIFVTSPQH